MTNLENTDVVLHSNTVACTVSAANGGRLSSLTAYGRELLVTQQPHINARQWGCYPMVPWAGRIRDGIFVHDGKRHQLERNAPPHAIHGTVLDRSWKMLNASSTHVTMHTDLGATWPYRGQVTHHVAVHDDIIECRLIVTTHETSMPAQVGWHPWFVRPCIAITEFDEMYVRDARGIPTGKLITPTTGPHDDCFHGARRAPSLNFDNSLHLTIESNCSHWVIYDEPEHALCVEPQSGPPDGFNLEPLVVTPCQPLERFMRLRISAD